MERLRNEPAILGETALFKFARLSLILSTLLVVAACAGASIPEPLYLSRGESQSEMPAAEPYPVIFVSGSGFAANAPVPEAKRIVIKNATLSIVVNDPAETMDKITAMAEEMGGYVVSANLYQTQLESGIEVPRASITVRVPAERLNEALDRIESDSERTLNKTIDSQDVTRDYIDLQSRLRNLEDAEAQLREIMASANKTEDVLSVYNRLVEVREQIEVIKGQIQYYEQAAALSSISAELLVNEAAQPLTIGRWQPVGVARSAIQSLIDALKFFVSAGIWILLFVLPVLLVIFLPLYGVFRVLRRWRGRRKKTTSPAPPAE